VEFEGRDEAVLKSTGEKKKCKKNGYISSQTSNRTSRLHKIPATGTSAL
jgi:hypothetical protein